MEKGEKASKERRAGIPEAVFVVRVWTKLHLAESFHPLSPPLSLQEDVDAYMRDEANSSAEVVLKRFDEQRNKYKFLEANLRQKKQRWVLSCAVCWPACCVVIHVSLLHAHTHTQAEEPDPRHPEDIRHGALYQEQAGKAGLMHQWLHIMCPLWPCAG